MKAHLNRQTSKSPSPLDEVSQYLNEVKYQKPAETCSYFKKHSISMLPNKSFGDCNNRSTSPAKRKEN